MKGTSDTCLGMADADPLPLAVGGLRAGGEEMLDLVLEGSLGSSKYPKAGCYGGWRSGYKEGDCACPT